MFNDGICATSAPLLSYSWQEAVRLAADFSSAEGNLPVFAVCQFTYFLPGGVYNAFSMYCDHSKQLSDNYGVSCERCGVALEGFGYGQFVGENLQTEPVCIHQAWFRVSSLEEECLYCHEVRPRFDPVC